MPVGTIYFTSMLRFLLRIILDVLATDQRLYHRVMEISLIAFKSIFSESNRYILTLLSRRHIFSNKISTL